MDTTQSLQEKVFLACDHMQAAEEKITREAVRQRTGGSDRDLSRLINEWRESKKSQALVKVEEEPPQLQHHEEEQVSEKAIAPTISRADIEQIKVEAQQRVRAKRLAVIQVARAYEENPELLPEDLRQEIEAAEMAAIATPLSQKPYYDPNALAQLVIGSL
jgi:hypothetical protein